MLAAIFSIFSRSLLCASTNVSFSRLPPMKLYVYLQCEGVPCRLPLY
jgi:hypothetical protein